MTIFHIKNKSSNYLVINIDYSSPDKVEEYNDYCILKKNNKVVAINIFETNDFPCKQLGMLYPTIDIVNWIKIKTNFDVSNEPCDFVVANVIECTGIEKTHLHQCVLTDGNRKFNVVCGAKNIKSNVNVVLAKLNAILPNGMQIIPRKLGVGVSEGMICSEKELMLKNESDGILILNESYKIGDPFFDIFANKNMLKF